MDGQPLPGGIANAGAVSRVGPHVLRPPNPHSDSIRHYLTKLQASGFHGAPAPAGTAADGRDRFDFIEGDVPVPPYPTWAQTDDALASIAETMRAFHAAAAEVGLVATSWSDELADPAGGKVICHNDVCLENVVFADGRAVALLDFDFAAPGRPIFDLAQMARMCVPIDDDLSAGQLGWRPDDRPGRLRLVADTYGLGGPERVQLLQLVDDAVARGGEFVLRRVERGDPNFVAMWQRMGGMERYDRRRAWWQEHRDRFRLALS